MKSVFFRNRSTIIIGLIVTTFCFVGLSGKFLYFLFNSVDEDIAAGFGSDEQTLLEWT